MPINKVNLSKLSRCNQYWDEMTPIEGGRLCAECNRCIVDFRDKTPHEIAVMHAYKEGALCGLYTKEQLNNKEKSKSFSSRFAYAKSLLMSIGVLTSAANLSAQTEHNQPDMEMVETEKEFVSKNIEEVSKEDSIEVETTENPFLISGEVVDGNTNEALIGATLWLKDTQMGVTTDIMGAFSLNLKNEMPNIQTDSELILVCQYIGFDTQEIPINLAEETYKDLIIKMDEGVEIIEFTIRPRRPFHQKVWRTLTFPFRKIGQLLRQR